MGQKREAEKGYKGHLHRVLIEIAPGPYVEEYLANSLGCLGDEDPH